MAPRKSTAALDVSIRATTNTVATQTTHAPVDVGEDLMRVKIAPSIMIQVTDSFHLPSNKFGFCGLGPDFCGAEVCVAGCDSKSECDPGWGAGWSKSSKCPLNVCCSKYVRAITHIKWDTKTLIQGIRASAVSLKTL